MTRSIYREEHNIFRSTFRKYVQKEVVPYLDEWEEREEIPRSAWRRLGELGFLCPWVDEKYGGSGAGFEYSVIITEELVRAGAYGWPVGHHSDIIAPYIDTYGTEEQKARWLPGCTSGNIILAIAMTEPSSGSDLQVIQTEAIKKGDSYVINGQKTFITNGICCDLVIVACKTDPDARPAHKGISLLGVEAETPGFTKNRKLTKMGCKSSDTAELFFDDCRVRRENLIGEENKGFIYMMKKLQQERLIASILFQAAAEAMLEETVSYSKERKAFGRPIGQLQHNTFKIVEMATDVELGRTFLNDLILNHMDGKDVVKEVSMAKWWIAEMANRVAYHCVQLFGGYGYMEEYRICRWYRDIRMASFIGGTTEIMKVIIGKMMGF
ncbi:MAG: acyl-CoA dehydrogenase family protein [Thermodesulfobacteriota bacterium]|jgi:acyl-CoA dehydrogenase